jgi:plasmid replication initiation protein
MFIADLPIKGDVNGIPQELYQLKWCLKDINHNILTSSNWFNSRSYHNKDGWDSISYKNSIEHYKNQILKFEIFCKKDNVMQLALSIPFDKINNVSYCFVQYIENYYLIVGLCVELQDKNIEFMVDGNVYHTNK